MLRTSAPLIGALGVSLMRPLRLVLLLVVSYLLAATIQLAVLHPWTADPNISRMAWERFPLNLLLLPIAPVLSFDLLVLEKTRKTVVEFLVFSAPFVLCALASTIWVYRRSPNRRTGSQ